MKTGTANQFQKIDAVYTLIGEVVDAFNRATNSTHLRLGTMLTLLIRYGSQGGRGRCSRAYQVDQNVFVEAKPVQSDGSAITTTNT